MRHRNEQRGLTFVGLMLLLVVGGSIVLIGLKVLPIYIESFQVNSALSNIVSQPEAGRLTKSQIYDKFLRHMEVNEIRRFSEQGLRKMMKIERKKDKLKITMEYQTMRPLFSNLSIIADWRKEFGD